MSDEKHKDVLFFNISKRKGGAVPPPPLLDIRGVYSSMAEKEKRLQQEAQAAQGGSDPTKAADPRAALEASIAGARKAAEEATVKVANAKGKIDALRSEGGQAADFARPVAQAPKR